MAKVTELDVQLIAATVFHAPQGVDWEVDGEASESEALVEFAGRACYESFDKPNPRTASNQAYLHHILEVGHDALLEHATATLYIRGLSRSATHELVRHRHFSFSQLSQRFVHSEEAEVVLPKLIAEDEQLTRLTLQAADDARFVYEELLDALESKLEQEPNALLRKKQARQAARAVLPNLTESRIVVTGNYRAWRHFIGARATEQADTEMRQLAVACLKLLRKQSPVLFDDFNITTLSDGTEMASSPYA
ncbi:FAD-dependent thymidylate synthase [Corynebacterium minutissimum]|uniref:Flavin-dependent thymidylate synthase n=1 Tax=Corynebacterium minutissimum TaxID=38301 RepID=A0A2X4UNS0_9CORY|nr:FAD-dependent thymidylate synthase [Corynebacterium minutissimum]KHO29007.1 thymidylate synthase ThyX [Corynebacterium minutissimum]QPS59148.1 FAD-dependent thymidylate synthase [Corynebacterium minutissimum]QQA80063.1 FAD-dependent thymidylate synthase [Corynebacterium minutissimum]SQH99674.1 FAD-dependent thymidylate synthase [Corynebacterium minutissimum]VEG06259.1 FAD-dependent thymidylate synthase [Corynebacterium minutissimum]